MISLYECAKKWPAASDLVRASSPPDRRSMGRTLPIGVSAAEASEAGQSSIEHLGGGRIREACYVFETETPGMTSVDPDPQMTAKLQEVLAGFWNGRHDPELLTPTLNAWLESETGKSILKTVAAEQGDLLSFTFRKQTVKDGMRVIHCKAVFEKKIRFHKFPATKIGRRSKSTGRSKFTSSIPR